MKKIILFALLAVVLAGCEKEENEQKYTYEISVECPEIIKKGVEYKINLNIYPGTENINSVELSLDGKTQEKKFTAPFSFDLKFEDINTGQHTLVATATLKDGSAISSIERRFMFTVALGDDYQRGIVIKINSDGTQGTDDDFCLRAKHISFFHAAQFLCVL